MTFLCVVLLLLTSLCSFTAAVCLETTAFLLRAPRHRRIGGGGGTQKPVFFMHCFSTLFGCRGFDWMCFCSAVGRCLLRVGPRGWSSGFVVTPYSIVSLTLSFFPLSAALWSLLPLIHLFPHRCSIFLTPAAGMTFPLFIFYFGSSSQDAGFLFSYLPYDLYVTQSFPVPRCTYLHICACACLCLC